MKKKDLKRLHDKGLIEYISIYRHRSDFKWEIRIYGGGMRNVFEGNHGGVKRFKSLDTVYEKVRDLFPNVHESSISIDTY